jgi:hypothetical protein
MRIIQGRFIIPLDEEFPKKIFLLAGGKVLLWTVKKKKGK